MPVRKPSMTVAAPCPLWRRLLALVYDLLVVVAIVMVVGLVCQLATAGRLIDTTHGAVRVAWWYRPLQAVVVGGYFLASWCRGGQTLGMRAWRLRLVNAAGGPPSLRQVLVRLALAALPLALLALVPYLGMRIGFGAMLAAWALELMPAFFDPERRALHDRLAGTALIRLH